MNNLRVSIVYPDGYAPSVASCGVLKLYPLIDDEHPIKIKVRIAGTHTNNGRTQDLLLTHLTFDTADKAEKFCKEALPCFQNDDEEAYQKLVNTMLKENSMKSVGQFYYKYPGVT